MISGIGKKKSCREKAFQDSRQPDPDLSPAAMWNRVSQRMTGAMDSACEQGPECDRSFR